MWAGEPRAKEPELSLSQTHTQSFFRVGALSRKEIDRDRQCARKDCWGFSSFVGADPSLLLLSVALWKEGFPLPRTTSPDPLWILERKGPGNKTRCKDIERDQYGERSGDLI